MARSIALGGTGSGRSRGILILAVAFGLLSFVLALVFFQSQSGEGGQTSIEDAAASEQVVVAARNIQPGERITDEMVTVSTVPGSALQLGRFGDKELVSGKTATTLILAGEQVVDQKISAFEGLDILSARIPDNPAGDGGLRGLALTVSHESWIVGGLVQPGDRVDVVGITFLPRVDELTGAETVELVTGIIAENIEVLAVSQTLTNQIPNLERAPGETAAGTGTADGEAVDGEAAGGDDAIVGGVVENQGSFEASISVTLAMTPDQAAKMSLIDAMEDREGQWRLVVRQKGDGTPVVGQKTWGIEDIFED